MGYLLSYLAMEKIMNMFERTAWGMLCLAGFFFFLASMSYYLDLFRAAHYAFNQGMIFLAFFLAAHVGYLTIQGYHDSACKTKKVGV